MKRILLSLLIIFCMAGPGQALEIVFQKNCSVDESVIRLGDIVQFSEESEFVLALSSTVIGQAGAPGERVLLQSFQIKNKLLRQYNLSSEISWSGSSVVSAFRNGVTIGPDRILNLISDYLERNSNKLPDVKVRFIPKSLPMPFMVPTGDLIEEIIPSNPSILGSSRFSIIFRIDGRVVKNMSVRGELEALAEVVVAAKSIKRGQILTAAHLTKALMDISKTPGIGTELDDFIGLKIKKTIRSGIPLQHSIVETLPVVRRGERVKIVIQTGSMLLTATGLAHSDGKMDQIIRVQNVNSNKVLHCRVAAPGLVEVML
jgi:flagella basal body P-ring formation protein FlgA